MENDIQWRMIADNGNDRQWQVKIQLEIIRLKDNGNLETMENGNAMMNTR